MRRRLVSVVAGAVALMMLPFGTMLAASTPAASSSAAAAANPGQGLEISPPVIELSADPGQSVTATIRVRNVASGELIAKGKADDFGPGNDETGSPQLLLQETGATRYSLKYWVQNVPDLRLAPQELKTTTITINVPANAEPGGHFGVIRFTAVPPNLEGTGVSLSASVGSLVLLRVSGPVTDKVSLVEFSSLQKNVKRNFFEYGPIDFLVRVKNEGTVHEKVQGSIEVTDWLGHKVGVVPVNQHGGNVLPDSVRRFPSGDPNETMQFAQKALFGYYKANLKLTYLDGKEKLTGSLAFWVIPWKLILLVIVGLVALFFVLRLSIKRYNEHIIAQARKRG